MAQSLSRRGEPAELTVLTESLYKVAGREAVRPEGALVAGLARVIPQEEPRIAVREIDVETPPPGSDEEADLLDALIRELAEEPSGAPVALRGGDRWVRGFEPVRLTESHGQPGLLRPEGVYLITGGLGGLGLELAAELARTVRAKLALAGRSAFPAREEWPGLAAAGGELGRKAGRLLEMEQTGAEILILPADATDPVALAAAAETARERFGALHGVIHAAGLPGGGLLQVKTPETAAAVLAPKVQGALALEPLLARRDLDFVLLCSSLNGVAGGFGQSDYCAANAFLDAFAQARDRRRGTRVLSVGWDRWTGVGMARTGLPVASGPVHPLLGALVVRSPEREVYRAEMTVEEQWVLSEHRIAGFPTVPGTTYLEMVRAAWEARGAGRAEIRNVVFLEPLVVREGERREVVTVLEGPAGGEADFRVLSRPAGRADDAGDTGWQEHTRGQVATAPASEPVHVDLAELAARCPGVLGASAEAKAARGFLVTGPRWSCLRRVNRAPGDTELLSELELPEELAGDLAAFRLHPALLDVATGHVQLVTDGDYLPLTYERLRILGDLPRRLWSHVRLHTGETDILRCDVHVLDDAGNLLVEAEGFAMRQVSAEARAQIGRTVEAMASGTAGGVTFSLSSGDRIARGPAGAGISVEEGVEAFRRVLASPVAPHVLVSCRDVGAVVEAYRRYDANKVAEELAEGSRSQQPRPSLATAYAAPGDGLEGTIAAVWSQVLGIPEVGAHDNFFELGGTSLAGVQVVSELKKRLGRDIPAVSIFEAPTVSALARYLKPKAERASAFDKVRARAALKRQVLDRARPRNHPMTQRGGRR